MKPHPIQTQIILKFINVVIEVSTDLPPQDLASVLIHVEKKLERRRSQKNEPTSGKISLTKYPTTCVSSAWARHVLIRGAIKQRSVILMYRDRMACRMQAATIMEVA